VSEQRRRHDKIVEPWARYMSPTKIPAQQNTLVMRAQTECFASIRAAALMHGPDKKIVLVTPRAG